MIHSINIDLSKDYEEECFFMQFNTPGRCLLLALLERALMDLFLDKSNQVESKYKKQAIRWFLSPAKRIKDGFTFIEVVNYLNLSSKVTERIRELVRAVQHEDGEFNDLYTWHRSGCHRRIRNLNS